ncbi:MAG: hypothetical protein LBV74_22240 [Tannerella sp.]|nr:hypothetical protein [Tannerella sp.]
MEQIEKIKSNYQNTDDFYVMADDANYHTTSSIEYLESKNIDIFYLDSIKNVCFHEKDTFDFSDLAWDFVLYKKNKTPAIVKAIDLKNEFENYFNIKDPINLSEKKNEWDVATETDIKHASSEELGDLMAASWSNDCSSNYYVTFSVAVGQFSFSTNYTMNTKLKKLDNTTYAVYFRYPIIRPIPEDMQDCRNYAGNIPVAKIERIGDGLLEFTWLGFYDVEKKARVHTQNPFNVSHQSVILGKCDE